VKPVLARVGLLDERNTVSRLDSERLVLRRFAGSDLAPFLSYRNDPEVARYRFWNSYSEQEALAFISAMKSAEPGDPGGWFQFAVALEIRHLYEQWGPRSCRSHRD
jgi:RimJ/RimL family protein N-acetyltransferase